MDTEEFYKAWSRYSYLYDENLPYSNIEIDSREVANFISDYASPFGLTVQHLFKCEQYDKLQRLGFSKPYIDISLLLLKNKYDTKKQFDHLSLATYSHSLLSTTFKLNRAEFADQFLANLNNISAFKNQKSFSCDLEFVSGKSRPLRRPFEIKQVLLPHWRMEKLKDPSFHLLPRNERHLFEKLGCSLNLDSERILNAVMCTMDNEISLNNDKVHKRIWANKKTLFLDEVRTRLLQFGEWSDQIFHDPNFNGYKESLYSRIQSKICYEVMIKKDYQPNVAKRISTHIGTKIIGLMNSEENTTYQLIKFFIQSLGLNYVLKMVIQSSPKTQFIQLGYKVTEGKRVFFFTDRLGQLTSNNSADSFSSITEEELLDDAYPIVFSGVFYTFLRIFMPILTTTGVYLHIGSEHGYESNILNYLSIDKSSSAGTWFLSQKIACKGMSAGNIYVNKNNKKHPVSMYLLYCLIGSEGIANLIKQEKVELNSLSDIIKFSPIFSL